MPDGAGRALLIMAGALALFFAPAFTGSTQFLYRDTGRMHWPMKSYLVEEMVKGRLPEWNPYSGLGMPLISGAVDAVQHPFNLLLLALPFNFGFKLWVLLSYLLAATGSWLWARRMGLGQTAATLAGLGFSLSGFLVSSSDNLTYLTALASLPWIFAAAHDFVQVGGPGRLAFLGLTSALTAAAGDPQSWGIAVCSLPVYAFFFSDRSRSGGWHALRRGVLATATAMVAAAPFILPVAAWLPNSSRGEDFDWIEYLRFNLLPIRLLELGLPGLLRSPSLTISSKFYEAYAGTPWTPVPWVLSEYVGVAVLALSILAAIRGRRERLLVLASAVFYWMALGSHGGFGQLARHLPVLSGFRYWEKLAVWPALLLPLAAAGALERLAHDSAATRRFAGVLGLSSVLLLSVHGLGRLNPDLVARVVEPRPWVDPDPSHRELQSQFERHAPVDRVGAARLLTLNLTDGLLASGLVLGLMSLVVLAISRGRLSRLGAPALALVAASDLAAANVSAYVLLPVELAHPPSPMADFLRAQPGLPRVVTPFPLVDDRWGDLSPQEGAALWGARAMNSGWNMAYRVANFEIYSAMYPARAGRYRRRAGLVKQLPGVGIWGFAWTVVPGRPERATERNLPPPYLVAAVDSAVPAFLLRLPHRERAYLAQDLVSMDRRGAMDFVLDDASVTSRRSVVEGPVPVDYQAPLGEAFLARDEPTRVEVATRSDRRALLVLNDTYATGWIATVDGHPAEVFPANYLARGVWVEAGAHTVVFTYRTPLLREGWILLSVGALALALWVVVRTRRLPFRQDQR